MVRSHRGSAQSCKCHRADANIGLSSTSIGLGTGRDYVISKQVLSCQNNRSIVEHFDSELHSESVSQWPAVRQSESLEETEQLMTSVIAGQELEHVVMHFVPAVSEEGWIEVIK